MSVLSITINPTPHLHNSDWSFVHDIIFLFSKQKYQTPLSFSTFTITNQSQVSIKIGTAKATVPQERNQEQQSL